MQGGFVAFYNSKIEIKVFYRLTSGFLIFESKLGSLRESHSGLHCFLSRRCDWSRKLVPPSQPISYRTKPSAACAPSFSRALCRLPFSQLVLIGSLWAFPTLLLVFVITLMTISEKSVEKCSKRNSINSNTKIAKIWIIDNHGSTHSASREA